MSIFTNEKATRSKQVAYKKLQSHSIKTFNNFKQINANQAIADCPSCGYKEALSISKKNGKELYFCHAGCDNKKLWRVICVNKRVDYIPCQNLKKQNSESLDNYIKILLDSSLPTTNTVVERYLQSRGIDIIPATIRFLPNHKHISSGQYFPVMLAKVTDYQGNLKALHRTYLTLDGKKADVDPEKMTLGNVGGYGVHLDKPDIVMAITEGIETGLSVQQSENIATWSALSAGGIRTLILPPLPLAKEVFICSDNDSHFAGQNSAIDAARRWTAEGRIVKIALPPKTDTDFNDLLLEADYV